MSAVTDVWEHLTEACQPGGDIWVRLAAECGSPRSVPPPAPMPPRCGSCGAYCHECTAAPAGWADLSAAVREHLDLTDPVQVRTAVEELRSAQRRPRRVDAVMSMRDPKRRPQRLGHPPEGHEVHEAVHEALLRRSEPVCRDDDCAERGRHPSHCTAA